MTVTCVVTFGDENADLTALRWATWRAEVDHGSVTTADAGAVPDADVDGEVTVYVAGSPAGPAGSSEREDIRLAIVEFAGRVDRPVVVIRAVPAERDLTGHATRPVIAGVPRSTEAWSLLDFAAGEAQVHGSHLALVRVWRDSDWEPSMTRDQAADLAEWRAADQDRLETAAAYVRGTHPGLEVVTQLREGNVWDFMTDAGTIGRMLVLGTAPHGREGLGAWAVAHLGVPVVLVPATADLRAGADSAVALART